MQLHMYINSMCSQKTVCVVTENQHIGVVFVKGIQQLTIYLYYSLLLKDTCVNKSSTLCVLCGRFQRVRQC